MSGAVGSPPPCKQTILSDAGDTIMSVGSCIDWKTSTASTDEGVHHLGVMDMDTGLAPGHAPRTSPVTENGSRIGTPTVPPSSSSAIDIVLTPPPPRQHTDSACESAPVSTGELQQPPMPAEPADDSLVSWTATPNAVELLPLPPLPACPSTCASWVQVPADLPVDDAVPSPLTPLECLESLSQSEPEAEYSLSPVGPPEERRCVQDDVLPLQTAPEAVNRVAKGPAHESSDPTRLPEEPRSIAEPAPSRLPGVEDPSPEWEPAQFWSHPSRFPSVAVPPPQTAQ